MEKLQKRAVSAFLPLILVAGSLVACGGGGGSSSSGTTSTPNIACGQPGSSTVMLSWSPPSVNADGSPVGLTAFRIHCGMSSDSLQPVGTISASDTSIVIDNLSPGIYFFAVSAVGAIGANSTLSNIESKTIN